MNHSSRKCNAFWIYICSLIFYSVTCVFGQKIIQVAWMVPFSSYKKNAFVYNASTSVAALALGIETVYNQSILPGYVFNVTPIDTKCESTASIGSLVDVLMQQKIDVVIGLPCSKLRSVAELLYYKEIPFFNWYTQEIDENIGYMYYRLYTLDYSAVLMTCIFLNHHTTWKTLVMVSVDSALYKSVTKYIKRFLYKPSVFHIYDDIKVNAPAWQIDKTLETIIKEARIIILVVPRKELRKYMLRAHSLGMTSGDYKFIFVDTMAEDKAFLNGDLIWNTGDDSDSEALKAFQSVIYIVGRMEFQNISIWGTAALEAYSRVFSESAGIPAPTYLDRFSGLLHDAFVMYAKALNKSLEAGNNVSVMDTAETVLFTGLTGVTQYIGLGRITDSAVYEMQNTSAFVKILDVDISIINDSKRSSNWTVFTDIGKDYPPDTPLCGFLNEKCRKKLNSVIEEGTSLALVVSICTAVFLLLVVSAIVWRWKRERDLLKMTWKIEYGDLNFDNRSRKMHSSVDFDNQCGSNINQSRDLKSRTSSVQSGKSSVGFRQGFTNVAIFQGEIVAVKYSSLKKVREDRDFLLQMKCLKEIKHDNLVKFIGVCLSSEKVCSVWEYCKKGSIQDIIGNESIRLDAMFKLSIAVDVCKGLDYIHNNKIIRCHGNLRSSNCVVDSRWVCKLTHFGIERLTPAPETPQSIGEHAFYTKLFWTAPEILRNIFLKKEIEKTPQSDVYSLGVILMELVCRSEPYSLHQDLSPKEIILKVARSSTGNNIFRPIVSDNMLDRECSGIGIIRLIEDCWTENPNSRPTAKNVLKTLLKISPFKKLCVIDNMILMMEKYTNDLETIVCERTQQLEEEKIKTETLLYRMLPRKIANDLKLGNTVQAEAYESVTIYFSDIVQFTNIASESTPLQIVCLLNELYTLFDEIISSYDVYKVETIGDAYMVVSGLPEENGNEHVKEIAKVSIKILAGVLTFRIPHRTHEQLRIRIGLHTGPVVAGVVGLTMPRYCLFGDTVNTASRMESNGEPLRIHISPETKEALSCFPNFLVEERGVVPIKGKGLMRTYWLNGELEEHTCKETDSAGLTNDKLC